MNDHAPDEILGACTGFEWDEHNTRKNWEKHAVAPQEAEQVFFNMPLLVRGDMKHSVSEQRYYALGHSAEGRLLFVAFTVRGDQIRIISVRDMHRKERRVYLKS